MVPEKVIDTLDCTQMLQITGNKSLILLSHSLQKWVLKHELQQVSTLTRPL